MFFFIFDEDLGPFAPTPGYRNFVTKWGTPLGAMSGRLTYGIHHGKHEVVFVQLVLSNTNMN